MVPRNWDAEPDDYFEPTRPDVGSVWQHTNGAGPYTVIGIANADTTNPAKHPVTVVYQGPNGKLWTRPLTTWNSSMKKVI